MPLLTARKWRKTAGFFDEGRCRAPGDYPQIPGVPFWITLWIACPETGVIATNPAFLGLFRRGGWCRMASRFFFRSAVNDLQPGAVIKLTWNQDPFQVMDEIMLESAENSHFPDAVRSWGGEDYPQIPRMPLWITLWVDEAEA